MDQTYINVFVFSLVTAIISMKWAMELGYSQARQILWGLIGFFFSVVSLLILYVLQLRKRTS